MVNILVFLFFFLLPVGWAKHWLVPSSLVNGVLVDYLMPDVWLQDCIAVIIIIANLPFIIKNWSLGTKKFWPLLLFLPGLILSSSSLVSLTYFLRFVLVLLTGYLFFNLFKNKQRGEEFKKWALTGLTGAIIWTGALAVLQLINQGTVFGWWFLGEPVFGLGTGGVKRIVLLGKTLVIPMATLPHSNIMGGFGLLSLIILLKNRRFLKKSWPRGFWLGVVSGLILAVLSFSIIVWLLLAGLIIRILYDPIGSHKRLSRLRRRVREVGKVLFLGGLILTTLLLTALFFAGKNFLTPISVYRRAQLAKISLTMIKDHPFFGVGWGGFAKALPNYWQEASDGFRFLQPVHNLFLLVLSELGIIGTAGLILLLKGFLKKIFSSRCLLLVTSYLLLSLFDHYFWTTTQGAYLWLLLLLG